MEEPTEETPSFRMNCYTMASRFTIYSINQISDLIYQISYIIYKISDILHKISYINKIYVN